MKITIRAGGIIRQSPERDLLDDYIKRANGLTRRCGFQSVSELEVDLRKAKNRAEETRTLLDYYPAGAVYVAMDERGKSLTSRKIAKRLSDLRDDGVSELVILIGGADGFDPQTLPTGIERWQLGAQTWPHKLLRVMLSEQIYRALSILAATPYHRD